MGPFISLVGVKTNHLIRIGKMAKPFGVNIRTLRYYDEIGVLKAVCRPLGKIAVSGASCRFPIQLPPHAGAS